MRLALQGFADVLLPSRCAGCNALTDDDEPLCLLCRRTLDPIAHPCPRCGLALPVTPVDDARDRSPPACLGCQRAAPCWSTARAPFAFSGELAGAIRRFKLAPDEALARPLARLLAPHLAACACDALVPVPLHPNRLGRRGFNQTSLLARLARVRHGPPVVEALDRVRDTPPQATLDAPSRHANLRRAFAVAPRFATRIRGAHVLLVDDVLTTGATASACTRALLRAGVARVDVLTLARTLP